METLTPEEAVRRLDALTGDDPEVDHGKADEILLAALPPEVRQAHAKLIERAVWWASA